MSPQHQYFQDIDVYLLDAYLHAWFHPNDNILDAGCGYGRNIHFLKNVGYQVSGFDISQDDIEYLQQKYPLIHPSKSNPSKNLFTTGTMNQIPFPNESFDKTLSIAVLHFAPDWAKCKHWLSELCRVTKVGGQIFIRTCCSDGLYDFQEKTDTQQILPDGSTRFVLHPMHREEVYLTLPLVRVQAFKTVLVEQSRSMCVWVLEKREELNV